MNGQIIDKIALYLAGLIFFSVLFLPNIFVGESLPTFQLVDFLMPFVLFFLFIKYKAIKFDLYFWFLIVFSGYILFTIILNNRVSYNEYFEIYKIIKYLILLLFFSKINIPVFLGIFVKPFFLLLILVNALHFFNVFNINYILEHTYQGDLNIKYFGKNTLNLPTGKRMVGMAGNPNTNALIFSFFTIYFIPLTFKKENLKWLFTALLFTFLCQSRTSLLILSAVFAAIAILKLSNWKWREWLLIIVCLLSYFIAWTFSSDFIKHPIYSNSMFNGIALESQSARGRWEIWEFLGKMILEKPLFGFGPNKNFFYENNIYSENEYILYTWRYGFIGLLAYFTLFLYPLKQFFVQRKTNHYKYYLLCVCLMLVSALTNNPFTERHIFVLFTISTGAFYFYAQKHKKELNKE